MRIEDVLLEKAGKMTLMAVRRSLTKAVLKSQAKRLKMGHHYSRRRPKKKKD